MDSGVSNTAFASIELIRDEKTNAIVDYRYIGAYYFKEELDRFTCQIDNDLFSHKKVRSLTYEVLPLTSIKSDETLNGVIQAQATTNLINVVAYQLKHPFHPVPATAIKYCLTGNGRADKQEMCQSAYALTNDSQLLDNEHKADAFGCCFYSFLQELKKDCSYHRVHIPEKYARMDWNFKKLHEAS